MKPRRREARRVVVALASALLLVLLGVAFVAWCWLTPYANARSYLPEVARNGAPLIEAIDRHCAERGHPPDELAHLVPDYLDALPSTGFPRRSEFDYHRFDSRDGLEHWHVYALVEPWWLIDADEIAFSSERRLWESVDL